MTKYLIFLIALVAAIVIGVIVLSVLAGFGIYLTLNLAFTICYIIVNLFKSIFSKVLPQKS